MRPNGKNGYRKFGRRYPWERWFAKLLADPGGLLVLRRGRDYSTRSVSMSIMVREAAKRKSLPSVRVTVADDEQSVRVKIKGRQKGTKLMGRVSVEAELANYRDVLDAETGRLAPEKVRRTRVTGVVDTGATRLVIPESLVKQLGLPVVGKSGVTYADQRRATRDKVKDVWLKLLGREGTFNAVVEPKRTDILIGAIVMEDLDLVVDCVTQTLQPRDPKMIISELE